MTYTDEINDAMKLSRYRNILDYYPQFYRDSSLIQAFAYKFGSEITSRIIDLLDFIRDNSRPTTVTSLLISEWEKSLGIPTSPSNSMNLRRSLIAGKVSRRNRLRKVDIATLCRLYLTGLIGYTRSLTLNDNIVSVTTTSGITVGQTLYIGPEEAKVVSINSADRTITVDRKITVQAFAVVSTSLVLILENPSNYFFNIFVNPEEIVDIDRMILAVHDAKPAHMGFSIYSYPGLEWEEDGLSWEGSYTDFPYDEDADYDEDAPYDEDPGEIEFWEGAQLFYTTDEE